ncbi:MAG: hypothetical protein OEM41_05955, partial [Ignavibacteria bacterium]|nr:hypothetical protein [Ignavibacteria bacterium]
ALLLVLCLGILDDMKPLGPGIKFLIQLAVASFVYWGGYRISSVTNLLGTGSLELGVFDYLVTVVWIIGVTNAINLIDGLDGLAAGVTMISCATIVPIALVFFNDPGSAFVALLIAGALLGFLRYNFNPARIFLGDSGSLFLGFALAILSVRSSTKGSTAFAILIPVLAIGLPIMDTLLAMIRRFLSSLLPQQNTRSTSFKGKLKGMFLPDRSHIHHRLIAHGFSHRKAVLVLYLVSCVLGIGALSILMVNNFMASLILSAVALFVMVGIRKLGYREMAILRNGVLLPLYERNFVYRDGFRFLFDIGGILVSLLLALHLTVGFPWPTATARYSMMATALVCIIQFVVLWRLGLYKGSTRQFGVADVLTITKSVAFAVIISGVVVNLIDLPGSPPGITALIIDGYLLLSFVLTTRGSLSVLKHFSRPEVRDGKKVVLYGAGVNGVWAISKIVGGHIPNRTLIGFLDDDPRLEGKRVQGFPVFGGHWRLKRLLKNKKVSEIVLTSEQIKPEVLRRIRTISRDHGVSIRRLSFTVEDVAPYRPPPTLRHREYTENSGLVLNNDSSITSAS